MKQCEMLGGICPVCHVYARSVFGICLCLLLGMQGHSSSWGSSRCSVLVHAAVCAQTSMRAVLSVCLCSGAW